MKAEELRSWWVVEWHPEGAFGVMPLNDALERNYRQCMEGVEKGHVLMGLFPSMESAREAVRMLKRRKREERDQGAEARGQEGDLRQDEQGRKREEGEDEQRDYRGVSEGGADSAEGEGAAYDAGASGGDQVPEAGAE